MVSSSVYEIVGGPQTALWEQSAPLLKPVLQSWSGMKDTVRSASRAAEFLYSIYNAENAREQVVALGIAQVAAECSPAISEGVRDVARAIFVIKLLVELQELAQQVKASVLHIFMLKNTTYNKCSTDKELVLRHTANSSHAAISQEVAKLCVILFRMGMRIWDIADAISDNPEIRKETVRQATLVVVSPIIRIANNQEAIGQMVSSQWQEYPELKGRILPHCQLEEDRCETSLQNINMAVGIMA